MTDRPEPAAFAVAELVRRALTTTYGMIARDALAGFETAATLEALVELLIANGVIDREAFAAQRELALARLAEAHAESWTGPSLSVTDPGEHPDVILDCEGRQPHCKAACCTFYPVALTEEEVRRGELLWDLAAPYTLPRAEDGTCANLDRETLRCLVWADRPLACRRYSCSDDNEVWQDFVRMVPAERVVRLTRAHRAERAR